MASVTRPATVAQLMTANPIVIQADASLSEAAELMDVDRVSGLPVCDRSGRLVGVLSQTDVVRASTRGGLRDAWPRLTARHLMTRPPITVGPAVPLLEAARQMQHAGVHRLVVVAYDSEAPMGVLSMSDLVRWMTCEPN